MIFETLTKLGGGKVTLTNRREQFELQGTLERVSPGSLKEFSVRDKNGFEFKFATHEVSCLSMDNVPELGKTEYTIILF